MNRLQEELAQYNIKSVEGYEADLPDTYMLFKGVDENMNALSRAQKKSELSQSLLRSEIDSKNIKISDLERDVVAVKKDMEQILVKGIYVLDQLDILERFAKQYENEALMTNLESMKRLIKSNYREIGLEEVTTIGELFNQEVHECVEAVEPPVDKHYVQYEIIDVVRKGYMYKGKLLREAKVIAVK